MRSAQLARRRSRRRRGCGGAVRWCGVRVLRSGLRHRMRFGVGRGALQRCRCYQSPPTSWRASALCARAPRPPTPPRVQAPPLPPLHDAKALHAKEYECAPLATLRARTRRIAGAGQRQVDGGIEHRRAQLCDFRSPPARHARRVRCCCCCCCYAPRQGLRQTVTERKSRAPPKKKIK